jgi:methionine synthase II (cobalamin-independent)
MTELDAAFLEQHAPGPWKITMPGPYSVGGHTIRASMLQDGEDPEQYLDALVATDNRVLEHMHAAGVTVGLHLCRGHNRSAWHAEGSYEPVADEAARFVPFDNLAISPQCGFASTMFGNLLTWNEQQRKLELIVETARVVWAT